MTNAWVESWQEASRRDRENSPAPAAPGTAARLGERLGKMLAGYRDRSPTNAKAYIKGLVGDLATIDESYFQPAELAALRKAAMRGMDEFANHPAPGYTKEHISYRHYDTSLGPSTLDYQFATDPSLIAQTTVGRALIERQPGGDIHLVDRYNFNSLGVKTPEQMGPTPWYGFLRWLGGIAPPVAEDRGAQAPGIGMSGVGDPRADTPLDVLPRHRPGAPAVAQTAQAVAETAYVVLGQAPAAAGQQHVAQERGRCLRRRDERLARVERQPPPREIGSDAAAPLLQRAGVVVEQREIVDVAHVARSAQNLLHVMIQPVEIDVGEELAGQVADRQAAPAGERRKQVVAGVVNIDRLLPVGAVDDRIDEAQRARTREAPPDVGLQDRVVDGREIAVDVAAQDMAVPVAEAFVACDRVVAALAGAVGVAVEDEAALEERLDDRAQGMVHHAVAERRGGHQPPLRLVNLDLDIAAGPPGAAAKLALQPQHLAFEAGHERGGAGFAPLAAHGAPGRRHQRGKARDAPEKPAMAPGHDAS